VFDLDDDVWNIDPSHHPDIYYHLTDPAWIHQMERDIAASHVVTVTTDGLAEKVSRFNSNVVVVPNRVPAWWLDYHQQNPAPRGPMLTIGWQGTYGHRMDWYNAAPHIGRVLSRHANVEAHMMGSLFEPMHYWTKTFFTPWTDVVDDYWRMVDFDIGLAPLRDHPFNWCKSSLKALEYGAMGIPVVASAVGPYLDYVRHGETGFLVREDHEWGEYLDQLIEDADLRAELGANGHKQALEHTIEENLDCWVDAWQLG
jgi:glycosyltransferase involved in cell wall biosynthesis